jgi:uncharacterized protein
MASPLMPKATAVWLLENTTLTFEQIANFCGLHILEIQAIADGESAIGMIGLNPITAGQLTQAEIQRCEADPTIQLHLTPPVTAESVLGKRGSKYTPVSKRQDRPDAIAWLLKYYPELSDGQICRLLGTTRTTINSVRNKTHWNSSNIKPRSPIQIGLCNQTSLDELIGDARKSETKDEEGQ